MTSQYINISSSSNKIDYAYISFQFAFMVEVLIRLFEVVHHMIHDNTST